MYIIVRSTEKTFLLMGLRLCSKALILPVAWPLSEEAVLGFSRGEPRGCVYMCVHVHTHTHRCEVFDKELVYMITEAEQQTVCIGQPVYGSSSCLKAWEPRESMVSVLVWKLAVLRPEEGRCFRRSLKVREDQCLSANSQEIGNSFLLSLLILFRVSTDWMRPMHIWEDNLLYSICWF